MKNWNCFKVKSTGAPWKHPVVQRLAAIVIFLATSPLSNRAIADCTASGVSATVRYQTVSASGCKCGFTEYDYPPGVSPPRIKVFHTQTGQLRYHSNANDNGSSATNIIFTDNCGDTIYYPGSWSSQTTIQEQIDYKESYLTA